MSKLFKGYGDEIANEYLDESDESVTLKYDDELIKKISTLRQKEQNAFTITSVTIDGLKEKLDELEDDLSKHHKRMKILLMIESFLSNEEYDSATYLLSKYFGKKKKKSESDSIEE